MPKFQLATDSIGAKYNKPAFVSNAKDDHIIVGGVSYEVKRFVGTLTHNGPRDVLAAVAGKMFRVVGISIVVGATATTFALSTETSGTAAGPAWDLAARQHLHLPICASGYGGTDTVNKKLIATLGNGSNCAVVLHYIEMTTGA